MLIVDTDTPYHNSIRIYDRINTFPSVIKKKWSSDVKICAKWKYWVIWNSPRMDAVKSYFKSKLSFIAMKVEFESVENFYDVVKPVYYVAKLFGYSPFTLPRDTTWADSEYQATLPDLLISICSFALYFFLLYMQLSMEKLYSQGILVIDIAEDILLAYLTCTSILSTSILLLLRKRVWNLINAIASIDNKVTL